MVWYDMIYDMMWYDMIWYDMIWYDMIWYDMIWYICQLQLGKHPVAVVQYTMAAVQYSGNSDNYMDTALSFRQSS